jgi:GAF domain-containing protein
MMKLGFWSMHSTQLRSSIVDLEQRVANRTRDLENQTLHLRAAAEVVRDAASIRDLDELLERSAQLVLDRFDFYHVGIFILDKNQEYAVLTASPTAAGQKMIADQYRLSVGDAGPVGRVAITGEPRITMNTGFGESHFNNPLLHDTHSEMALPLKVESTVIGVLDIQSDQLQAFNQDDIAIMQVMADQLATAIERTRLLEELERNLHELEHAHGQYTREGWQRFGRSGQIGHQGYRFDNLRIEPIAELSALGKEALSTGKIVRSNGDAANVIAIPIKLRGQTIGVVNARLKDGLEKNTLTIIEAAIERLASALESARLYEEASLRADREQSISQVTSAISSSTEYEDILRAVVREIGTMLNDTEVGIQILGDASERQTGN